ncbi:MAG: NgoFVII family restriction endonuclease, partial [Verrucomicrobiaceae bacterium]|nr:NgoFVII family restriction endonuclease [Verrucomicrobiaceae bacterium]
MENASLKPGLYERLLDEELSELLKACPELVPTLEKLDDEGETAYFSQFLGRLMREVLPQAGHRHRLELVNRLIELLAAEEGLDYTRCRRLLAAPKTLLTQVRPPDRSDPWPHPETPLSISSLLTGAADDPPLEREIRSELQSCDRVDILV